MLRKYCEFLLSINCDSSLFCFQNPNTASRCLTWCQPQHSRIMFPLHFVSKYETVWNCQKLFPEECNVWKHIWFADLPFLLSFPYAWPIWWRCFGFTVSPGTHRGPNCHYFHRSDWAQQSGRPSLTTQHLKMDGWKTTKTPFLGWLFGRSELLVSGGVTSLVLFFFGR